MYKYSLIVSQYYNSYYTFIVKFEEDNFIDKFSDFAKDLYKYKRDKEDKKDVNVGDFGYCKNNEIGMRYNINDAGDLYVINSEYANYLKCVSEEFKMDSLRMYGGYIKKAITKAISEHHSYDKVKEVVEKHFEIV
ncbi:hypothetical protein KWV16_05490 [Clostridioides difficile]|nr:hypothetical protein [Clostridioides difficile]